MAMNHANNVFCEFMSFSELVANCFPRRANFVMFVLVFVVNLAVETGVSVGPFIKLLIGGGTHDINTFYKTDICRYICSF